MTYTHIIAQRVLGLMARCIIKKYRPRIIGITGSVGKTTTKEAIAHVLAPTFTVRKNEKNFNTEIGVPLTVIGIRQQPESLVDWIGVVGRAMYAVLFHDHSYPAVLILEMGADHPGDIARLVGIAPCDIGVVTAVGPTHLEYFKTIEHIAREKSTLISHLRKGGVAILNHDDALVYPMRERTSARVISFGFSPHASVRAIEYKAGVHMAGMQTLTGLSTAFTPGTVFKVSDEGSAVPVRLPGHVGNPSVYAALAAAAVGKAMGLNLHEITDRLSTWPAVPGRLSLLAGVRSTLIIDDSYNSSPLAVIEALSLAGSISYPELHSRWAVLGDMLELGGYTHEAHREVGVAVMQKGNADYLVTVGERARDIARSAQQCGMREECIYSFATAEEAGSFIQNRLEEGDLLLVKGSRAMRMERVVKELMAEPLRAKELLVSE